MEQSKRIIEYFANHRRHEKEWMTALAKDVVPSLFGALICVLPNLKELRLGDAWLLDFPLFANTLSPAAKVHVMLPTEWRHHFLAGALASTLGNLKVLEIPADMTAMHFHPHINACFDFRRFQQLEEVSLTMRALQGSRYRGPPANPTEIFPETLEVLRISEASCYTVNFLNQLCLARKQDRLPQLRRVEIYHIEDFDKVCEDADKMRFPHPVNDVRTMCRDAELGIYLYFPPVSMKTWESGGGTPWRMKTEAQVLIIGEATCWIKDAGVFGVLPQRLGRVELEWDKDGDAVML
jgi:hypothetical protein